MKDEKLEECVLRGDSLHRSHCPRCGVRAWLWLMILYLIMEYSAGRTTIATKIASKLTAVLSPPQARSAKALGVLAVKFVCANPGRAPAIDSERQFKDLSLSYSGDVVKTAQALTWRFLEPAVPPRTSRGLFPIHALAEGCMKDFFDSPDRFYVADMAMESAPQPCRNMIVAGHEDVLAQGLLGHGVLGFFPQDRVARAADSSPLSKSIFGVGEGTDIEPQVEVLRLIMSLKVSSPLFEHFRGKLDYLPLLVLMRHVILAAGEELVLSSVDLKCMFYLFGLPQAW